VKRWFRHRRTDQVVEAQWRTVQDDAARARQTRQQLLTGQEGLVASIEDLLFRHDPIGINFDHNTDEYRSEAETITLRLPEAATEHDLRRIIHEEFVRWFDASTAGPAERYDSITREIWQIRRTHR
jgi:hypothetical protein